MTPASAPPGGRPLLALRYALRDLRSGLRGFYVFLGCLALGVAAIAGVGSVAAGLAAGLDRQGRTLLGGDISFALIQREATAPERAFLDRHGTVSVIATMRAMARAASGELALVDLKAVDARYPMLGEVTLAPPIAMADLLARRDGAYGAGIDALLLARLNLKPGDRVSVGEATFEIRGVVEAEPDKLAGGVGFGPRFLVSEEALRATHLLQPGSLVRWVYRLRLPEAAPDERATQAVIAEAQRELPQAGWDIRSRGNASPQLERSIERFTQYLTLVGLAALLVGGVGVANAVRGHIDARRETIATLKALGATGRDVFAIYLAQVLLLAALGSAIGLAIGAALPFVVATVFGALLPLPIAPGLHPGELALSFAYGLLAALAFGLWPLGRVDDVAVGALFRDEIQPELRWPRRRYLVLLALAVLVLAAIAIGLAYDRRVAIVFVLAATLVFALLRSVATALMALVRRLPRPRLTMLRLALANIARPGALTPSVVMSLGLGLAVLVTVTQIDGNLRRQFLTGLPEHAPSFYFIDIPSADAARFADFLKHQAPGAAVESVPMLRGRIVAANGVRAEDLKPAPDAAWALQSDRGVTYASEVPRGSTVVAGDWWAADYAGPPLVSLEKRIADGLGLKIGDTITVNVLGRDVTATVANLRTVDWQSLGINFVLVFSPRTFAGAPHTGIATLTDPRATTAGDAALVKAVAASFPMVTSVRVREAIDSVSAVVTNLVLAIRGASAVTLVTALLVLGGALAAGHRQRLHDAVILKTLGATRARLIGAYALEYLLIGLATALFGAAAGSLAAWQIVTRLMTLGFAWEAGSAALMVAAALVVTMGLGLAGTLLALNEKPATVLRSL